MIALFLERYHREKTCWSRPCIPVWFRLHRRDQFHSSGGSKYHQDQAPCPEVLPKPERGEEWDGSGTAVLSLRSFSMILTVAAIPSLSTECSVKSLGMERAEWGEFRIGSRSITLQTRSRWVTLLIKKKCKMSLVEFPNHQSCHLWLGTVLYSGHSCSEGGYCGAIHNGQPAGPRLYILHHSQ